MEDKIKKNVITEIEKLYKQKKSDTEIAEILGEQGILISRRKVGQIRRIMGPPIHRPFGPETGLTDEQYAWWSTQQDRPILMRRMIAFLMTLSSGELEYFKEGKVTIKVV